MSGSKFLLDTNIIIEIFDGNKAVADKLAKTPEFFISSIVLGELYMGINRVVNKEKNLKRLNDFLELCTVINIDASTSKIYGGLIAALYKKGKPLPTNDV